MLRRGIVVAVHPEDHSVDLVMADDGSRLTGVQVLTPNGSTRSGSVDLPAVPDKKDKWDITKPTGQDMHAIVASMGRYPVVLGFTYPQINQMLHKDPKLRVDRHQSDVMSMIDGDGNMQLLHPGGAFLRIGEAPERVDPVNGNEDKSLAIDRNTGKQVYIRVQLAGSVVRLTMTPDGDVDLQLTKDLSVHAGGNATVDIDGNVDVTIGGNATVNIGGTASVTTGGTASLTAGGAATVTAPSVTLDTPQATLTGNLSVAGAISGAGAISIAGAMSVSGPSAVAGITSNGKNIGSNHAHLNSGGPGTGGVPV